MSTVPNAGSQPASISDPEALRNCWHPVAYVDALGSEPLRVWLLGEAVVLWRDSRGEPHALNDVCVHRGTALSLGRAIDDQPMCRYHGWRYGTDGRCTANFHPLPGRFNPTRRIPPAASGGLA